MLCPPFFSNRVCLNIWPFLQNRFLSCLSEQSGPTLKTSPISNCHQHRLLAGSSHCAPVVHTGSSHFAPVVHTPTGHVVAQKRTVCVPPCIKSRQHPKHFPTSPLGQYYVGSLLVDFGGRKRSGVFRRIWPSATVGKLLKLTGQAICIGATHVSYGVRTHAHLRAVDLKSTPLTTRAN